MFEKNCLHRTTLVNMKQPRYPIYDKLTCHLTPFWCSTAHLKGTIHPRMSLSHQHIVLLLRCSSYTLKTQQHNRRGEKYIDHGLNCPFKCSPHPLMCCSKGSVTVWRRQAIWNATVWVKFAPSSMFTCPADSPALRGDIPLCGDILEEYI